MQKDKNHNLVMRGKTWYFRLRKGKRVIRKTLSNSVIEARRLRNELLKKYDMSGTTKPVPSNLDNNILFGEMAQRWANITKKRIKTSTYKGYQTVMNAFILKRFGNTPISRITYLDVEEFVADLECSNKRINNILIPMRGVFKLAHRSGFLENNIMSMVENRKIEKASINPLSMDEIKVFLNYVDPFYHPFFVVAFFTGMRAGEMSALKWKTWTLIAGLSK